MFLNGVTINGLLQNKVFETGLSEDSLAPPIPTAPGLYFLTLHPLSQRLPGAQQCRTACSVLLFLLYKSGESEPEPPQSGICHCQPVISFLISCVSSFDNPCHM